MGNLCLGRSRHGDYLHHYSSAKYCGTELRKSRTYTIMSGLWKAFKRVLAFKPDGSKFYVMANAKSKAHGGSYRYPAPGSQPQAFVPGQENDDLLYDTKYYTRDSRRHPEPAFVISGPKTPKHFLANSEPLPLLGSPGNNNDDVLKYDPTGLRSAMSATNAQHREAILKVRPDPSSTGMLAKRSSGNIEGFEIKRFASSSWKTSSLGYAF